MMSVCIGIDVSKATLDVATDCGTYHLNIPNTPTGYTRLLDWLQDQDDVDQIALEASGRYGEAIAVFLVQQGYAVSYLNPKQIHQFSQMKLHYNKTDKQDAKLIAEYCKHFKPGLYQPQDAQRQQLQQRSRRLDQLQKMRQQKVNRSQSGIHDPFTQEQILATIAYFDTLIEQHTVPELVAKMNLFTTRWSPTRRLSSMEPEGILKFSNTKVRTKSASKKATRMAS